MVLQNLGGGGGGGGEGGVWGRGGGGGGGGGVYEVFYEQCGSGEAGMVHRTVSCSKVG